MPNYVYRNDGGVLSLEPVWESPDQRTTSQIDWIDINNDGLLELAAVNYRSAGQLYTNLHRREHASTNTPPRLFVYRPGQTPAAKFFSTAEILTASNIEVRYLLIDKESDPVLKIIPEFSPNGGGQWFPATPGTAGDGTRV